MKRWILAVLVFSAPAFAASMNTYASQLGGANLVQLIPGELPLLTTTYAGTPLQSTSPAFLFSKRISRPSELSLSPTR
jgi:hypothetical protein